MKGSRFFTLAHEPDAHNTQFVTQLTLVNQVQLPREYVRRLKWELNQHERRMRTPVLHLFYHPGVATTPTGATEPSDGMTRFGSVVGGAF